VTSRTPIPWHSLWAAKNRPYVAGLLLLLVLHGVCRFSFIAHTAPYPHHVDEPTLVGYATHAIQNKGDPGDFLYPTLPSYLIAVGQLWGFTVQMIEGHLNSLSQINARVFPYYAQPEVHWPAKYLFALLSLLVLAMAGLLAWQLTDRAAALVLAPALLSVSPLFLYHSRVYLNADIVSSAVVMAGILYLSRTYVSTAHLHRWVLPGVFAGLAAASKYNHGALVVPFGLALFLHFRGAELLWRLAALGASLGATFLTVVPYSVIHFERFMASLERQRSAYVDGWPGYTSKPGWEHFVFQTQAVWENFGWAILLLALWGIVWLVRKQGPVGWLVCAYPVFFFVLFCFFKTNTSRNLLPVYCMLAVLATVGLFSALDVVAARMRRPLAGALAAVLVLVTAPWLDTWSVMWRPAESRVSAARWIEANIPEGSKIYVARSLAFDRRTLRGSYDVEEIVLQRTQWTDRQRRALTEQKDAYFLVPEFGHDPRRPQGAAEAEALNAQFAEANVVAYFAGSWPVWVRYGVRERRQVPRGDPRFSVRRGLLFAARASNSESVVLPRRYLGVAVPNDYRFVAKSRHAAAFRTQFPGWSFDWVSRLERKRGS